MENETHDTAWGETQTNKTQDELEEKGTIRTWGTPNCDINLTPLQDHHYCLVAGTQGSGKTSWCFYVAEENTKIGGAVLFYSLEMSVEQLIMREARNRAGITKQQWRDRSMISELQKTKYRERKLELEKLNGKALNLIGAGDWEDKTIENILTHALSTDHRIPSMIVIDNLDLIHSRYEIENNRRQEHISRYILQWTNENKIPVILIHHFRKDGKGVDGIRGSGKLSDDSDLIFIISRPSGEGLSEAEKYATDIFCPKDRDFGEILSQRIYFNRGRFEDTYEGMVSGFNYF